jgi:ParB family transcriptional regulator, chromosome partitioning protein
MAVASSKGLGKGLSALMAEDYSQEAGGAEAPVSKDTVSFLALHDVVSGKYQPRQFFEPDSLRELADSIREHGVMQPILVRELKEKRAGARYEIIAGERRWRASKLAGLDMVPVLIKEMEDRNALEIALIENIQRQDLSALEEAQGFQQLMDSFSYTQEEISVVVGKSRSHVANCLRLLSLPQAVKDALCNGDITAGHARALMQSDKPEALVYEVVRRGLNVRQTENLAKSGATNIITDTKQKIALVKSPAVTDQYAGLIVPETQKDPDILAIEETLHEYLGMQVLINDRDEKGNVIIFYESLAQLDAILKRIGGAA